jgi:hypothetical protein
MTIVDAIHDNLYAMIKDVMQYNKCHRGKNKKELLKMISHVLDTLRYFDDWCENPVQLTEQEKNKLAEEMWQNCLETLD